MSATHADHATHPVKRTSLAESIAALAGKPALHGDNGSTPRATTVLAMLDWLGVKPSYSRRRVSDDNAYADSVFRTAKYRPEFPVKGFADQSRHAQPRARRHRQRTPGRQRYAAVGCMNEATTSFTRAETGVYSAELRMLFEFKSGVVQL